MQGVTRRTKANREEKVLVKYLLHALLVLKELTHCGFTLASRLWSLGKTGEALCYCLQCILGCSGLHRGRVAGFQGSNRKVLPLGEHQVLLRSIHEVQNKRTTQNQGLIFACRTAEVSYFHSTALLLHQ